MSNAFKKLSYQSADLSYHSLYGELFSEYRQVFQAHRRDVSEQAFSYMSGLLKSERGQGNLERIEEEIGDLEYHQYQHFISNSPWDHQAVLFQIGQDMNDLMQQERHKSEQPTGLLVDESAHLKKGVHSVGVSRQYAGGVGKVDNCQVGVYASLCTGERSSLINERLFLPKAWIEDESRCNQAKIPEEARIYKSKPILALEMIDQAREEGIRFDWVGGDGLYGHGSQFSHELDQRGLLFVLDIHKDQRIFTRPPQITLIEKTSERGRPPTRLQADHDPIRVDAYLQQIPLEDWEKVSIRKTAKGWLKAWIHLSEVWLWDGQETEVRKRVLILRKTIPQNGEKQEIKYSVSNAQREQYRKEQFAHFQAQRYWVERDFENAKSELAMSDYQIRKWLGWHHHHAIVLMALLFMLKERMAHQSQYPLMSLRDARILVTTLIAQTVLEKEPKMLKKIRQMEKRHRKRKKDIDRFYIHDG